MDIQELYDWFMSSSTEVSERQRLIAERSAKRSSRGYSSYLMWAWATSPFSGIGLPLGGEPAHPSGHANCSATGERAHILDEPSIGLHQRDNHRLIDSLKKLRDSGNSVVVVEHDKDMMLASDYIVDMGPFAGQKGGDVVFEGVPAEMLKKNTLTSNYLNGKLEIAIPEKRREGNGKQLIIEGASGNNLKNVTVAFPLGTFICVTGVSGSGKSTLINETLQPILSQKFYRSLKDPLPYKSVKGTSHLDKV